MASIRKDIPVEADPEEVWAAVRDVGAVHQRLASAFVVDVRLEGEVRIVTFANGLVAREPIVDIDDAARRLVWTAVGGRTSHYNASLQVFAEGEQRCRIAWVVDLLPHELAGPIGAMVEAGSAAIKRTLEASERARKEKRG
jgi:carbon monoxide dehydrogenase subunit G